MDYRSFVQLLKALSSETYVYSGLFCIICYLVYFRKMDSDERITFLIVALSYLIDFSARVMAEIAHDNTIIYNLFLPVSQVVYVYLFNRLLNAGRIRNLLLSASVLVFTFTIINFIYLQGRLVFNTNSYVPANLLIAVYAFVYLRQCMEDIDHSPYINLLWWFSVATLIDYAGSLPVLAMILWLQNLPEISNKLFELIILTLYNTWFIIIASAILWIKRRKVYSSA